MAKDITMTKDGDMITIPADKEEKFLNLGWQRYGAENSTNTVEDSVEKDIQDDERDY